MARKSQDDLEQVQIYLEDSTKYNKVSGLSQECVFCGHRTYRKYNAEDQGQIFGGVCKACYPNMTNYLQESFEGHPEEMAAYAQHLRELGCDHK